MKNNLLFTIGLLSLIVMVWKIFSQPIPPYFLLEKNSAAELMGIKSAYQLGALFKTDFASHGSTPEVHSATAIELNNNDIMAFWYGGTREGHKDVAIYKNVWSSKTQQWGQETILLTRNETRDATARYIRKLGNPVVTRDSNNDIWLFYVSVSVGGWAGSSINFTTSKDEGLSWSSPKRLITSPFLNLSTLIKGTPIHYTDGSIGLPAYHEFLGKFGELLRINSRGEIIDKIRLSWGMTSLQPIIFTTSQTHAFAMMRYHGKPPRRILTQASSDAGLTWTPVKKSKLPNPGSGIIGLELQDNRQLLLAFNNHRKHREDMTLATSIDDGQTWQIIKAVEENRLKKPDKTKQFSYPWLLQSKNGNLHLFYTWHKSHIKHLLFNSSWLEETLAEKKFSKDSEPSMEEGVMAR